MNWLNVGISLTKSMAGTRAINEMVIDNEDQIDEEHEIDHILKKLIALIVSGFKI